MHIEALRTTTHHTKRWVPGLMLRLRNLTFALVLTSAVFGCGSDDDKDPGDTANVGGSAGDAGDGGSVSSGGRDTGDGGSGTGGDGSGGDGGSGGGSGGDAGAELAITSQPADRSVEEGATAAFSVVASDATGYQWQRRPAGGSFGNVSGATSATYTTPVTTLADDGTQFRVIVTGVGNELTSSAATLTVFAGAALPPDPADVAPPIDSTLATDIFSATSFLYTGDSPIQTGVASGTIEARRVAVLRGRVLNDNDTPLSGVTVSVVGHPELGQTLSRIDGMFDLVVNGGGQLTLRYAKNGFIVSQRAVDAPWRDYEWLPDVVLVPFDSVVTTVAVDAAELQVARGSSVTDADGTRQATVLIPPGTTASMQLPDGSSVPLTTLGMRATEFTVGENGPAAMPATLPPTSAYTYAVELSVDEAVAAGATEVRFNQPLPVYLENFLGFDAGSVVPSGYYDRLKSQWIASDNGRVIDVVSISSGLANLDIDGDGAVDDDTKLAMLDITQDERARLALLYAAGDSLWRVPVTHFTPWDFNWPFAPPPDAVPPRLRNAKKVKPAKPDEECGSVIGCESQSLGESVAITGTEFSAHYRSDRTPGYQEALSIPLTGPTLPPGLLSIELEVTVAGNRTTASFAPSPNLTHAVSWDGKDAYGRQLNDTQPVSVRVGYTYQGVYTDPILLALADTTAESLFGRYSWFGTPVTGDRSRQDVTLWQEYETSLELTDSRSLGFGGWTLNVQHAYDADLQTLWLGNGKLRHAEGLAWVVTTVAGTGVSGFSGDGGPATAATFNDPRDIALGPDGSLYIADQNNHRVRRVSPTGIITTVAGNGGSIADFNGDGGPAVDAELDYPMQVVLGPDGTLYIADNAPQGNRIRRVGPDGIISTFAGLGSRNFSGNGAPAVSTSFQRNDDLALAADGSMYLVNQQGSQIHRIGSDGIVSTIAGLVGSTGYSGDGGPARAAALFNPSGVAVTRDGNVFIADSVNRRVRRVSPAGIITTFAGNGVDGALGDGGLATAAQLAQPGSLVVADDGTVYIAQSDGRIRSVAPDGVITTFAGSSSGYRGDQGPATGSTLDSVGGMALSPDGALYFSDRVNHRVRRIAKLYPSFDTTDVLLASEDGREIYIFDARYRHLRTLDALTGAIRYEFQYGSDGYLSAISDGSGNVTDIERLDGAPVAIIAPGGQRTELALDDDGWLSGVTNPAGEAHTMTYSASGLMQTFTDPNGAVHTFTYDGAGHLIEDADPIEGSTTLVRTTQENGHTVTTTTALGRTRVYRLERLPTGAIRRTTIAPSGATSVRTLNSDGSEQTVAADGTITTVTYGPDPRWGMLSPVAKSTVVRTPAGRQRTVLVTRTATLSDPLDLLSLTQLTDSISDNGAVSTLVYTAGTRTFEYTTAAGRSHSATLDELGRVIETQTLGLEPISYAYDDESGLLTIINQGSGATARDTNLFYDPAHELISVVDPLDRTLGLGYDGAGRAETLTLPDSSVIALSYDAAGNTESITPSGRSAHAFAHTAIDQVESYTPPSVGGGSTTTSYVYDADRALTSMSRPDGSVVELIHDDVTGRPEALELARGSLSYGYDTNTDRLLTITAPGGLGLGYAYDGSLLTGVTWTGATAGSTSYTYDDNLRVSAELVNGGNLVSYGYDDDGLLITAGTLSLARDPDNGLLTGTTLSSVVDATVYNGHGEPIEYSASYDATSLYSVSYERDAGGRITEKVETIDGTTATYVYGYDSAGHLTTVTKDASPSATYAYAGVNGNRTAANGVSASYDAQDRLISFGSTAYAFAESGELLGKTAGAQTTSYEYDELGNLLAVSLPSGTLIDYLIDGEHRRIGKMVNGSLVQGFLYQGMLRPIAELDGDGALVSRFVYASRQNVPDYMVRAGSTYRIITDQLGSPRLVVDTATGSIAQRIDYDAFGQVLSDTNPGFQPFGFAGGLYDNDTKLTRFGARDYDAHAGRWTAKDPIGFGGNDANLYAYVHGDPVNSIDVDGLSGANVCRPIYVRSKGTHILNGPNVRGGRMGPPLEPGHVVNFKGFDPSGQFAHIQTILPNGKPAEGWVLKQNLSSNPPATSIAAEAGSPLDTRAFASSSGVATKG